MIWATLGWLWIAFTAAAVASEGINGRYWYLLAVSPGEVVSVNTDLTKDECEHAASVLTNDKHWPHAECDLQNPPPRRAKP